MFKVQIVKGGSTPFHFKVSAEDLSLNDAANDIKFIDDVEVNGEIVDGGRLFNINGSAKCRRSFTCDRCLAPSIEDKVYDFEEELERDEVKDGMADLTEMIRDTLIAAQPIKNLCKEDCKGLCPVCGVNLNETDCNCEKFIVDPRLEALQNFLRE